MAHGSATITGVHVSLPVRWHEGVASSDRNDARADPASLLHAAREDASQYSFSQIRNWTKGMATKTNSLPPNKWIYVAIAGVSVVILLFLREGIVALLEHCGEFFSSR